MPVAFLRVIYMVVTLEKAGKAICTAPLAVAAAAVVMAAEEAVALATVTMMEMAVEEAVEVVTLCFNQWFFRPFHQ